MSGYESDQSIQSEDEQELETVEEPQTENQEAQDEGEKKKVVAPVKIHRPRYKLDVELLRGPKGIGALPQTFENVKFKGPGHEEEDLETLLKTYQYWGNRLFPKYPFQDCLNQIQKLGHKKAMITHLKKMRLDMLTEDKIDLSDEENQDPVPVDTFSNENVQPEITEEQLERMRINRENAAKIRRERLAISQAFNETEMDSELNGGDFPTSIELEEET